MKKLTTLLLVTFCFLAITQASKTTNQTTVLFNTAKHELTKPAQEVLIQFIKNNKTNLDYEITIEGHTDSRGGLNYNHKLSLNRAEAVRHFLINKGIDKNLISIKYKGELDPEKPNVNDNNMTINRRVEVTITTYHFDNIEELEAALQPNKTNNYIINPKKERVVKGRQGVKILIKPNTFVYEDGTPVTEDISFNLTESLSYKDFIASGLLTKSADELLESGGMIKVGATTVSGKPVKVKAGKEMTVAIPNQNRQDNMEVFLSDKGADWTPNNQPITVKPYSIAKVPFPRMNKRNVNLPTLEVDKSNMPTPPSSPRKPRKPHAPKKESYQRNIAWYKLNKEEIRNKQTIEYQKAMNRYDTKIEKYEKRIQNYQEALTSYQPKYDNYLIEKDCWEEQAELAREAFKSTPEYLALLELFNTTHDKNYAIYKAEVKKWKEERKLAMAKAGEDMDKLGISSQQALDNYVFTFNEMACINVDRFYHMEQKDKQLITLTKKEAGQERVLIIFKNINSMLPMYLEKGRKVYVQENFPKKEEAVIFAYKVKDGKPMLCYQNIDELYNYQLNYKPTTFAEIKSILNEYNQPSNS